MMTNFSVHFDEIHAITCKAVRQIPEERRDFRPALEMMTAFDLVFHMFSQERVMLVGCKIGSLDLEEFRKVEQDKAPLRSIEDLALYGETVHSETSDWLSRCGSDGIIKPVSTFLGPSTPEKLLYSALEHIVHHRGQLYVYLRLMGMEPVFVWTGEPMSTLRGRMRVT